MKYSLEMRAQFPTVTYGSVSPVPSIEIDDVEVLSTFEEFREDMVNDPLFKEINKETDLDSLTPTRKMLLLTRYLVIRQLVDVREDLGVAAGEFQRTHNANLFEIKKYE